jgi:hypothetical protein
MLGTRTYDAWRVWTHVWSHGMVCVPVLDVWTTCAKRESFWLIALVCAGMLMMRMLGHLGGVFVIFRPNKDEFEPTSGSSVSGMACVVSCPTLLVEGEPHQHINPSAKCILTLGLALLREARMKV